MRIVLTSPSGVNRSAKIGFSWTTLLFGPLVPLLRKDFRWFAIQLICFIFTGGLSDIIFAFFYNETYIKSLLDSGYKPYNESVEKILKTKGYIGE